MIKHDLVNVQLELLLRDRVGEHLTLLIPIYKTICDSIGKEGFTKWTEENGIKTVAMVQRALCKE